MAAVNTATPLVALDAVVIDTETTGLNTRKARIVEIAAVTIAGGRIVPAPLRRLVRPDIPIPRSVSAIHGIDDQAVADEQPFREVWPEFSALLRTNAVIGHILDFDFAILRRECRRARLGWFAPLALDTRILAEIVEPKLRSYSLDDIATWLGVEISGRHSAAGDAMATAQIFQAMVPKLRARGIRTLAEASAACRAFSDALHAQKRLRWSALIPERKPIEAEEGLQRIDSYPYRHRIAAVMTISPQFTSKETDVREALARMMKQRISSLFVRLNGEETAQPLASECGIVTERDLLRAVAEHEGAALAMPVERFASRPLAVVPAEAFVYRAIGRMNRLKVRHLGVVDDSDRIVGALSARDLLRLRAGEAVMLGDEIDHAEDIPALATAWAKLPKVASSLIAEGVDARNIAAVISRELGAMTREAAIIAERRMKDAGQGDPPCPYTFAILGSAGRGESLLAMDQDNALIFATGEPDGPEDRWFAALATHISDILHETGVPYCKGGVMAKNPQWRGSLQTWHSRIAGWVERSRPEDLLAVDIFFDMRGVHGDTELAERLWRAGFDTAQGQTGFAKLLAEAGGHVENALGWFGWFKTENGRVDLKKSGLFGIVTAARVLAVRHHVVERSTPTRLAGIIALGLGGQSDLEELSDAQGVFLDHILSQQLDDIAHGLPATNAVVIKRLSRRERGRLRAALESVEHLEELTRDLLFKG